MNTETSIAFVVPWGRFIYKLNDRWNIEECVTRESIREYLRHMRVANPEIKRMLQNSDYPKILNVGMYPNQPGLINEDTINLWVEPTLKPSPHPFPTVERILSWVTDNNKDSLRWLLHWTAQKVQDPALLPKIATILLGTPGSGKSSYGRIMREMLGPRNCAVIERSALESNFNSSWVSKLFVQAEEIVSPDHMKELGERLKLLVTSEELESETKGIPRKKIANRMAWLFCSNDPISPLQIEAADRRYTIFANHAELTPEYRALVAGCFDPRDNFTPSFAAEVSGFYDYLLHLEVDKELVRSPHHTEARQTVINASERGHEAFIKELRARGADALMRDYPDMGAMYEADWDFGERGIKTQYLYGVYARYCKANGFGRLANNKFGAALKAQGWNKVRNIEKSGHRPMCYVVPRSPGDDSAVGGLQTEILDGMNKAC